MDAIARVVIRRQRATYREVCVPKQPLSIKPGSSSPLAQRVLSGSPSPIPLIQGIGQINLYFLPTTLQRICTFLLQIRDRLRLDISPRGNAHSMALWRYNHGECVTHVTVFRAMQHPATPHPWVYRITA